MNIPLVRPGSLIMHWMSYSIHVVHYEKGQRRELDIEVDKAKPVNPAVQDVGIIVARKVGLGSSGAGHGQGCAWDKRATGQ